MSKLLGIKFLGSAHYCVRLKDTLFGQKNSENCSSDSIILPSKATFMNSLVHAVNHIFEALPCIDSEKLFQDLLPLRSRIDAWYREHSEDYIQERQILAIQAAVQNIA